MSNNGVLVLSIWPNGLVGQKFMNEAKRLLVEQETDEEVRNMLVEKLTINEYFRSEEEILAVLAENKNLWENMWMEYRDFPCIYDTKDKDMVEGKKNGMAHEVVQRRKEATAMYKCFCNFVNAGLTEEYEEKFWSLAESLAGGYLSTAGGLYVLVLKKLQKPEIVEEGGEGVRKL